MINVRGKGVEFEQEVARALRVAYPRARRGLGQPRSGRETPDVDRTPWWIECKRARRPNVAGAVLQAKAATDGRPVLVVTRADGAEALATMRLKDLLPVLTALQAIGVASPLTEG